MEVRFKDGNQDAHPAWENIYLINAKDVEQAEAKAIALGRDSEGDSSGTFTWNDRPASWVFAGIRKIIEISNAASRVNEPEDGSEITYSTLAFDSEEALKGYASGESVELTAVD